MVTSDPESLKTAENTCQMILYTPNVCGSLDPFISCLAMKGKMAFIGAITEAPKLPIFGPVRFCVSIPRPLSGSQPRPAHNLCASR